MLFNGIFNNSAFGMESLTSSILKIPFVPGQAGALGIFGGEGVSTTSVDIEQDGVNITIIPSGQRGGPPTQYRRKLRTLANLKVPHFVLSDIIKPEQIQDVRASGVAELQTAIDVVDKAMMGMTWSHDATLEYGRIGAVKGVIYDWDGSTVLTNLFTALGATQETFDFDLGDSAENIMHVCLQVKRYIEQTLGQARRFSHIHCFCGNDFFDALVAHPEIQAAYKLWQNSSDRPTWGPNSKGQLGDFARSDMRTGFAYGDIFFENYIGYVPGANGTNIPFVPAGEAHFFPAGVPELFKTVFAPGNFMGMTNTPGLPRYAIGEPLRMGRGLELETESNPLSYCSRPETLVMGVSSTWPTGIVPGSAIFS